MMLQKIPLVKALKQPKRVEDLLPARGLPIRENLPLNEGLPLTLGVETSAFPGVEEAEVGRGVRLSAALLEHQEFGGRIRIARSSLKME